MILVTVKKYFQQVILTENLMAKDDLDMESFIAAAEQSNYHGSDLAVRVLSQMLKIPIAAWNSHFLWVSSPYISIYKCPSWWLWTLSGISMAQVHIHYSVNYCVINITMY